MERLRHNFRCGVHLLGFAKVSCSFCIGFATFQNNFALFKYKCINILGVMGGGVLGGYVLMVIDYKFIYYDNYFL